MGTPEEKVPIIEEALRELSDYKHDCRLCPRMCHADREGGERGYCKTGALPVVSNYCLHFGEEPCLSGYYDYRKESEQGRLSHGSGTVFFSGCNLGCVFCQNYQISRGLHGNEVNGEELADIFLLLQDKKALNINLVTPTHVIISILEALKISYEKGLAIPVAYNTSSYDSYESISKLKGIIDIYLPDMKFFSRNSASTFSNAPYYPEVAKKAIKEMFKQVGHLELDSTGKAIKGLIIRHLILPGFTQESCEILEWISKNISIRVQLSLMGQYHPCNGVPENINREISRNEYETVLNKALNLGFENIYTQSSEFGQDEHLTPDFDQKDPFGWNRDKKYV